MTSNHEGKSNHEGHEEHQAKSNHKGHEEHQGTRNHEALEEHQVVENPNERFAPVPSEVERAVTEVVDAAFVVHAELGPGFDERVYHRALVAEFRLRALAYDEEVLVPIMYRGERLCHYRIDLIVADAVIVEVKAVKEVLALHEAQLMSYLKATGKRLGLLMNFNVKLIKHGLRRFIR